MDQALEKLIRLQQLESTADDDRRKIADHPDRIQALDARLHASNTWIDGEAGGK